MCILLYYFFFFYLFSPMLHTYNYHYRKKNILYINFNKKILIHNSLICVYPNKFIFNDYDYLRTKDSMSHKSIYNTLCYRRDGSLSNMVNFIFYQKYIQLSLLCLIVTRSPSRE